jgi:hypothetical protein
LASGGTASPDAIPLAMHGAATASITTKRIINTIVNSSATPNNPSQTTQSNSRSATKKEAQKVKEISGGQNRIVIGTPKKKVIYDINPTGKDHGGVPTPHKTIYSKNFVNGEVKSVFRDTKKATPVTVDDLRIIRNYIKSLKK